MSANVFRNLDGVIVVDTSGSYTLPPIRYNPGRIVTFKVTDGVEFNLSPTSPDVFESGMSDPYVVDASNTYVSLYGDATRCTWFLWNDGRGGTGGGGTGDVTRANLTSTVAGLGSSSYVSTASLISTVAGLGQTYLSSTDGFLITDNLTSTTAGLGEIYLSSAPGLLSTPNLVSTTAGLGDIYLS
jgi:hypothetical protein